MTTAQKPALLFAIAFVFAAGGGFLLGRYTAQSATLASSAEAAERSNAGSPLIAENARLKERLDELERERESLADAQKRTEAEPKEAGADKSEPKLAVPEVAKGALFSDPRFAALDIGLPDGVVADLIPDAIQMHHEFINVRGHILTGSFLG